jgi:hypothetical protein
MGEISLRLPFWQGHARTGGLVIAQVPPTLARGYMLGREGANHVALGVESLSSTGQTAPGSNENENVSPTAGSLATGDN